MSAKTSVNGFFLSLIVCICVLGGTIGVIVGNYTANSKLIEQIGKRLDSVEIKIEELQKGQARMETLIKTIKEK